MSRIQQALEARKKLARTSGASSRGRGRLGVKNAFAGLSPVDIGSEAMEKHNILPAVDDRAAITAYKILRTRVLQRMRSNNWQTLIVTSAGPSEGKTLTACNLAVSMSNDVNQAVILVDLDLQRPSMAEYFGLEVRKDIRDYLTGAAAVEETLYRPAGLERIAIIPNSQAISNSSELLASPRMGALIEWVRAQGPDTLTIFDMPPVLACDDVLAFLPSVDSLLLVVSEGVTERASLTRTMELLGDINVVGIVLNQSRERNPVSSYY